jgi:hypothetical protein
MKNKEEPSSALSRRIPAMPGDPSLLDSASMRTTGSTVRADDIASAAIEKLALSVFPMSVVEALAEQRVLSLKSSWAELDDLRLPPAADPHDVVVWGGCPETGHTFPTFSLRS